MRNIILLTLITSFPAASLMAESPAQQRNVRTVLKCPEGIIAGEPFALEVGISSDHPMQFIDIKEDSKEDRVWRIRIYDKEGNEAKNWDFWDGGSEPYIVKIQSAHTRNMSLCRPLSNWSPVFPKPGIYVFQLAYKTEEVRNLMRPDADHFVQDFNLTCESRVEYPDLDRLIASMEEAFKKDDSAQLDALTYKAHLLRSKKLKDYFLTRLGAYADRWIVNGPQIFDHATSVVLRELEQEDVALLKEARKAVRNEKALRLFDAAFETIRGYRD